MNKITDINELEVEITKIAYRQPVNKPLTQYELYSQLLDEYKVSDPYLKNELKMNMSIVMRHLSVLYDDFKLINNNGVLSIILLDKEKPFIDNQFNAENINTDTSVKNEAMPLEKEVVQWIIDNNIDYSITKEDLKGNSILHYLVIYNDFERINKVLNKYDNLSFFARNNEGFRPIDFITNIKISNIVLTQLYENEQKLINENKTLNEKNVLINKSIDDINKSLYFMLIIVGYLFYFIYLK
jgi:hypothetical protein